ncbi:lipase [Nocardia cyriacigeorgica]|uniref:Lipase n=1 Tax=Nocardia cyriacigeorgica TaxID=135487 RepID=A0A6P1D475_9NOCA|nr:lipase [Nocardia cyriacigeorgica]NEW51257.1 lipase [Nocardia cyriacigeorgica]
MTAPWCTRIRRRQQRSERHAAPEQTLSIRHSRARRAGLAIRRLVLGISIAAVLALGNTVPAVVPVEPTTDSDAFYTAPADIGEYRPGDIIRSRSVPATGFEGTTAWQLTFRSTNSRDEPIAAVTTLFLPAGTMPDRPLVSYQPFVNSLGTECAPSHSLFDGTMREAGALNLLLAQGWAVTVPDHLGPDSAYGAAQLGGRITLDGIRAVRQFAPADLGDSPVALVGYSGGGMATGFAATLAPDYAPELPIVGAAAGGVPMNLGRLARDLGDRSNQLFGLGFAAAVGLEREYPARISLDRVLNPAGVALRERIEDACMDEIVDVAAGLRTADVFTTPPADDPAAVPILRDNSLETFADVPAAPLYLWHGTADMISAEPVQRVADRYCAAGVPVQLDLIAGADHSAAILPGALRALDYLAGRFAGMPPPQNC